MSGTWTVDPNTLQTLRLSEARKAFDGGDLDRALIEAEELLDEDPSHKGALELVSQAALCIGDVVMALEALNRFVELHTPDSKLLHSLAVARFQDVDYPGALVAAEQATGLEPSLAPAWHYQGLALERMEKHAEAEKRFAKAADHDSENFPIHPGWDDIDWPQLLDTALQRLPAQIQGFYDGVPIRFADFPAVADLLEHSPPLSPFTDALYRGSLAEGADPWVERPAYLVLFPGNLSRPALDHSEIIKRITDALMHEAMHWLGTAEPSGE